MLLRLSCWTLWSPLFCGGTSHGISGEDTACAELTKLEFVRNEALDLAGEVVFESVAEFRDGVNRTRRVRKLSKLLTEKEVAAIELHTEKELMYGTYSDSVDGLPTYEAHFIQGQGRVYASGSKHVFEKIINTKIEPYVRQTYKCPACYVCNGLSRRYFENERRDHPSHFDVKAYVTVVFGINPESYTGGLYVEPNFNRASRAYIDMLRGDVVAHQHDVSHGVDVLSGSRFSVILWVSRSKKDCDQRKFLWKKTAAKDGDPVGQYNYAMSLSGAKRMYWFRKSAEQGFVFAQTNLAAALMTGEGTHKNATEALAWLHKAAGAGDLTALKNLGVAYFEGKGTAKDPYESLVLFRKAQELGAPNAHRFIEHVLNELEGASLRKDHMATSVLAKLRLEGMVLPLDRRRGMRLYRLAAANNYFPAYLSLASIYYQGSYGVPVDKELAMSWCLRAIGKGSPTGIRFEAQQLMNVLEAEGIKAP